MSSLFDSNFKKAIIALTCANIIWGAAPPIFKWALNDIGPFTLAFIRFFFAAIILLPFAYKHLKIERSDIQKLVLMAFLGITINISFFFIGLEHAPSINASLIGSAAPIFLIFGSIFFLRERPKKKSILGAHIGLLGVLVVLLAPLLLRGTSLNSNLSLLGNIFYVIAMLGSLGNTIIGKKIMQKNVASAVTFWAFTVGAITFAPLFLNEMVQRNFVINLTLRSTTGILFGIVLSSAVAYFLFFWALKYLQAYEAGIFAYIDPVVTVLIAIPLIGEFPDLFFIIGSILIFLGIYVAEGRIHYHPLQLLHK